MIRITRNIEMKTLRRLMCRPLFLSLVIALYVPAAAQSQSRSLVFRRVTVIDATGSPAMPGMTVVIVGDRIAEVGPAAKIKIPKGALILDGRGKFLIPGLWDMHVHLDRVGEAGLKLFIANGVTGVREMGGGDFAQIKLWRQKIGEGTLLGPQIKASGPILESPRFIQILERLGRESLAGKRIGVGTAAEATNAVNSIAGQGADFLKIRTNASPEAYQAIAAEARRTGLSLVGHAPNGLSLLEVSDAGQKSIEHGLVFFNNQTDREWSDIGARFLKNGTHVVPTIIAGRGFREMPDQEVLAIIDDGANLKDARRKYVTSGLLDYWRTQIDMKKYETPPIDWKPIREKNIHGFRLLHQAGVRMMAGTDLAAPLVFPGFSLHEELRLLVNEVGLTPMEALQSATRFPSEFLGLGNSVGTIQKGRFADLVLLEADPLADIGNTEKIAAVVVRGKPFLKPDLARLLTEAEVRVLK